MRPTPYRALAVGVALLGSLPLHLPAQSPRNDVNAESPEVRKLVVHGVHNVDLEQLIGSLATQASACRSLLLEPFCLFTRSPSFVDKHYLDRVEYRRDILRIRVFYWERGYREAQVDTAITPHRGGGITVTFTVTENQPTLVSRLTIEYDSTLISSRERRKLTMLRAGGRLDMLRLDSMRVRFENAMWDKGYADAVTDTTIVVDAERRLGDVRLRVTPNWHTIVGPITIQGAEQVGYRTILNALSLHTGEPFRRSALLESQQSLYESNLFRQAIIHVEAPGDSVKPVVLELIEAPLHEARLGAGFNNVDFIQTDARFTHYNIFGGARRLDVLATFSNLFAPQLNGQGIFRDVVGGLGHEGERFLQPTWDASIDLRQPAFLHRIANALGIGAFAHRRSAPGIFIDRGYGATATFTRNFAQRAPVSANYRYEITHVEASDVYYCVAFGVCDTTSIISLRSHQSLSPATLTGFIDRTDVAFSPTRGYRARIDLEHASGVTFSDYRYNRGFADFAAYTHFTSQRSVLAGHLKLGAVRALGSGPILGVLHPRKRFYAGGAQSVRGYAENQLGPRILTIPASSLAPRRDGTGALVPGYPTDANGAPCDTTGAAVQSCNPNSGTLRDQDFIPQAVGGTSLIEGSVEFRFRVLRKVDGAVFLDGALVGQSSLQTFNDIANITKGTGAITPGFGFRYVSPVGPVRVDVGWAPKIRESLPVVTAVVENGQRRIVPLNTPRVYSPGGSGLLNRLTLHLSVGQAY